MEPEPLNDIESRLSHMIPCALSEESQQRLKNIPRHFGHSTRRETNPFLVDIQNFWMGLTQWKRATIGTSLLIGIVWLMAVMFEGSGELESTITSEIAASETGSETASIHEEYDVVGDPDSASLYSLVEGVVFEDRQYLTSGDFSDHPVELTRQIGYARYWIPNEIGETPIEVSIPLQALRFRSARVY